MGIHKEEKFMIEFLRGWAINIVTLVIFIVLLEILVPSGRMKKYINLISGFLIMITLITPILKFIEKESDLKGLELFETININKMDIDKKSKVLSKSQSEQVIEVYRQKIISQLESYAAQNDEIESVKADVIVDEDLNSEKYGEIKRVYLSLNTKDEEDAAQSVSMIPKVEKIQVGPGSGISIANIHQTNKRSAKTDKAVTNNAVTNNAVDSKLDTHLKDKINELLGVKKEDIIITCQRDETKTQR